MLIEVENDLGFSAQFQRPGEQQIDPGEVCALLAAILAHGCNLGLYTMEKVAPDIAYRKLKYVSDWRLVEENQRAALAGIVHGISRLDAAGHWGDGTTSASDGQRFAMPLYSRPIECTADRDAGRFVAEAANVRVRRLGRHGEDASVHRLGGWPACQHDYTTRTPAGALPPLARFRSWCRRTWSPVLRFPGSPGRGTGARRRPEVGFPTVGGVRG